MGIVYEERIVLLTVHTLFRKQPRKIGAYSEDMNTMTCQTIWGTNAEDEGLSRTNATKARQMYRVSAQAPQAF